MCSEVLHKSHHAATAYQSFYTHSLQLYCISNDTATDIFILSLGHNATHITQ
uniref:Uncharacterized protein n=1 Tax=Anguilla anguilla TaxID=7936 RepID=A0A0E9R7L6_ANGAN